MRGGNCWVSRLNLLNFALQQCGKTVTLGKNFSFQLGFESYAKVLSKEVNHISREKKLTWFY